MTALIIEDMEEEARLIARIISPLAGEVIVRARMAEALVDIGSATPPEIICVDLGLPDSGRDFTMLTRIPQIRRLAPDSLILVITGMASQDDITECIRNGADAVIAKLEILPEAAFMERLRIMVLELIKKPRNREANLRILETVAKRIAEHSK